MKKILIYVLALILAASMTACKSDDPINPVDTSVTTDDTSADTTSVTTEPEETTAGYMDAIVEKLPAGAADDGLEYHEADNGNLIIVSNDVNAWAYDTELDEIASIVNYYDMLMAADIGQRSGDYFEAETTLSVALGSETDTGVEIEFTVTAADGKSRYVVYAFYSFDGGLGDYHYRSIAFPGSGQGVTVTNVADYEKLIVDEDNSIFRFTKAIVENDVSTLEELCCVDKGVLSSWEGMEISDYTITRMEFSPNLEELYLRMTVTKSDVEKIPVGNNVLIIREGMNSCTVEFATNADEVKKFDSPALDWINDWIFTYGAKNPDWIVLESEEYIHAMLDFYSVKQEGDIGNSTAAEFEAFCEKHFEFFPFSVDDEYVKNHGGHGLPFTNGEVVKVFGASDYWIITVDYYADPLGTVLAFTHEFTLIGGEGGYKLQTCERTYDSGLKAYGWSN